MSADPSHVERILSWRIFRVQGLIAVCTHRKNSKPKTTVQSCEFQRASRDAWGFNRGGSVTELGREQGRGCCPQPMFTSLKTSHCYLFSMLDFHIKHPLKKNIRIWVFT